jgi:hypothetical protein
MSETTQNVAKIMTFMMRMNDEDFKHTLEILNLMSRQRNSKGIKNLYVKTRGRTSNSNVDACGKIGD